MKHALGRSSPGTIVIIVILVVLATLWLYPLVWTLSNSLKTSSQIYTAPWALPVPPVWDNFPRAWTQGQLGSALSNSLYTTGLSVVMVLAVSLPAAFGLTNLRPPRRNALFLLMLAPLFVPSEVILVPLFTMFRALGLLNRLEGLAIFDAVTHVGLATVILASFFRIIPKDLLDAARVDGAGRLRVLALIVIPLAAPGIFAVSLVIAISVWNDFFGAVVLIQRPESFTVPLALSRFSTAYTTDQGLTFAGLAVAIIPALLLFLVMQRSFVRGLTAGAIRG